MWRKAKPAADGARRSAGPGYGDSGTISRFYYSPKANKKDRAGSDHPTVKPLALLRYLLNMALPPRKYRKNFTVLDMFAGSGTTAHVCQMEGIKCVSIERNQRYYKQIRRRLKLS